MCLLKLCVILVFKELDLKINTVPECNLIISFGVQLQKQP